MARQQITRTCEYCGSEFTRRFSSRPQRFCSVVCVGIAHTTPQIDRFFARVAPQASGCWFWTGFQMPNGYGKFPFSRSRNVLAHRWVYDALVGPIPRGLTLDHLCRVRHCVNPTHLEPVTQHENTLRGESIQAQRARQTHCTYGHPFDETNTYRDRKGRHCRTCAKLYQRRLRERRRSA